MNRLRLLAAVLLAAVILPTISAAAPFKRPSVLDAMQGSGYSIPPEWAGVWQYEDSTYTCTPRAFTDYDTGLDTLCTGVAVQPDTTGGIEFNCTGTVTPTSVDLTCTGGFTFMGCTATYTDHSVGTRTGDTFVITSTYSLTWSPPLCAFQADTCEETVTRSTRLSGDQTGCPTPARQGTWGALKTRYR